MGNLNKFTLNGEGPAYKLESCEFNDINSKNPSNVYCPFTAEFSISGVKDRCDGYISKYGKIVQLTGKSLMNNRFTLTPPDLITAILARFIETEPEKAKQLGITEQSKD